MRSRVPFAAGIVAALSVVLVYRAHTHGLVDRVAESRAGVAVPAAEARPDRHAELSIGAAESLRDRDALPRPAAVITAEPVAEPATFAKITGLLPLPAEELSALHGRALEERLHALDRVLDGRDVPAPPSWFEEERTTLANRYFAENPSAHDEPSPELARRQGEYERLVARHLARYGETNLEKLAEAKEKLFHDMNETSNHEIAEEEKAQ